MIKAFLLYSGDDGHSYFKEGKVKNDFSCGAVSIHFKESPIGASYDMHTAPNTQYVINLLGTLEFTTSKGEQFVFRPGDVLIATDIEGLGHKWRIIDKNPWKRGYVVFRKGAEVNFIPD